MADCFPHEGAWHEQLGREGICLHLLGARLAVAPVDAHEAVDEKRLAFVDQEVPDFVRDSEALPRWCMSGVDANHGGAAVTVEHPRDLSLEGLVGDLRSES